MPRVVIHWRSSGSQEQDMDLANAIVDRAMALVERHDGDAAVDLGRFSSDERVGP